MFDRLTSENFSFILKEKVFTLHLIKLLKHIFLRFQKKKLERNSTKNKFKKKLIKVPALTISFTSQMGPIGKKNTWNSSQNKLKRK